jgi:hypothetical protein
MTTFLEQLREPTTHTMPKKYEITLDASDIPEWLEPVIEQEYQNQRQRARQTMSPASNHLLMRVAIRKVIKDLLVTMAPQ